MSFIRVRFRVNWGRGDLEIGECYDLEDTAELRALIARGLAEHVPYNTDKQDEAPAG